MGWFSKSEPVYSELGIKLYEAIDDHPEWQLQSEYPVYTLKIGSDPLWPNQLLFTIDRNNKRFVRITVQGTSVIHSLTSADYKRIATKVYDKCVQLDQKGKLKLVSEVVAAITKTKAITFDSTATALAKAVLAGDATAVLAIIDYFIEHRESVNDHVNPTGK